MSHNVGVSEIEHLDVLVVGAGLSGIGAAYRLQTMLPGRSWAVLEARDSVGGTWDLFRYPGVRSDSDMMTLGFPFEPWTHPDAIADGSTILEYLRSTAHKHGLAERIRLGHKVVEASWSTADARWTVTVEHAGARRQLTCGFLYLCSGYYDYDRPHDPELPGISAFEGEVVHPQFWPDDLAVEGRRVVVIGSGATAMTLVPALAELGAEVTMLQRTPTWVTALPRRDRVRDLVQRVLPTRASGVVSRYKNVLMTMAFYELSRRRPAVAKALLSKGAARSLGSTDLVEDHFTPTYDPWDQRLCVVPDGDLFEAVRNGRADVVTDTIEELTPHGLRLQSGVELPADVVVTATGLRIKIAGGIAITVDGQTRPTGALTVYRGTMFADVPNLAACVGYVNASWTLRADLASRYVCRLLAHMEAHGWRIAVPRAPSGMAGRPLLPLGSGYVRRAAAELPRQGDGAPWLMRQNYLLDRRDMLRGDVTEEMAFSR
ncbi:NAD(P)/FAD-dependent oxidoreductase [Terrabacter sp. MAHUQ-38]|nr:NAD(P)/FAD-dependent oxidoreductase [Terrabacter sp. MAHUQ-38]MBC9820804.1 NAD(P)/FAD-dependent oxidoreductase [Terrabacter sp. MAHUQ-38]